MQYTEFMENSIFEMWGDESEDITEDILSFLNDDNTFRNFGEGLSEIIQKKIPENMDITAKEYLKKLNQCNGYILNRNTIENWFNNNRPKKGEQSREHMYILSFLLKLTVEETCELFRKVYYDKPFNLRSIKELLYYYCIKNDYTYEHAELLYKKLGQIECEQVEETLYTQVMKGDIDQISEDDQILEYIITHPHNFQINNTSAKGIKSKLLSEILPSEEDRIGLRNRKIGKNSSFIAQEIYLNYTSDFNREEGILDKNKSLTSISTMLDIILGINMVKAQQEANKSIFKNANLPQEIMNRFPTKHTFSKSDPSFEELRKMIILLFSYKFWFLKQYSDVESDIEDYQMQLDALLYEANLQPLYYGNPFDWMFLYCSTTDYPLDLFRDIMSEAFLYGDVNESYK